MQTASGSDYLNFKVLRQDAVYPHIQSFVAVLQDNTFPHNQNLCQKNVVCCRHSSKWIALAGSLCSVWLCNRSSFAVNTSPASACQAHAVLWHCCAHFSGVPQNSYSGEWLSDSFLCGVASCTVSSPWIIPVLEKKRPLQKILFGWCCNNSSPS